MKLIHRDTDYAIRAMMYLGRSPDKRVSTAELERRLSLPRPFIRRILPKLEKSGILKSLKGAGGGFSLRRSPEEITLLELVRVLQGPLDAACCAFQRRECPRTSSCRLRKKLKEIEQMIARKLEAVTIRNLMAP